MPVTVNSTAAIAPAGHAPEGAEPGCGRLPPIAGDGGPGDPLNDWTYKCRALWKANVTGGVLNQPTRPGSNLRESDGAVITFGGAQITRICARNSDTVIPRSSAERRRLPGML